MQSRIARESGGEDEACGPRVGPGSGTQRVTHQPPLYFQPNGPRLEPLLSTLAITHTLLAQIITTMSLDNISSIELRNIILLMKRDEYSNRK